MQTNMTVAFLDTRPEGFPKFEHYFRLAPKAPLYPYTADLYVYRVVPVPEMSLVTLAEAMATELKQGENALVYTHAEPGKFYFPIEAAQPTNYFDVKEAAKLSYHLDLIQQNRVDSPIIDPFLHQAYGKYVPMDLKKHEKQFGTYSPASYLKMADDTAAQILRGDLIHVRNKKIGHLAIRACRLGQNADFMRLLGLLFGAESVSAPKLRTASIAGGLKALNVVKPEQAGTFMIETRAKPHGVGGFHKYEFPSHLVTPDGYKVPYVLSFKTTKTEQTKFNVHDIRANMEDAIMEFLWQRAGYSALGSELARQGGIALHALQGPHNLIFPMESEYLRNMEFVRVTR